MGRLHTFVMLVSTLFLPVFAYGPAYAGEAPVIVKASEIRENIFASTFISEKEIIIVGDNGRIFLSGDLGKTWTPISSGTTERLFSVCFPDPWHGWIAGRSGLVLHSADGGRSWKKQTSNTTHHLFSIHFSDRLHGCAAGDWGAIVVTGDGGQNWKEVRLPDDVVLYAVRMAGQGGVIVGEYGNLYRSQDFGNTWTGDDPAAFQSLFCLSGSNGVYVAGGLDGVIVYSHDDGKTGSRLRQG